ncbi:MAG: hypothetical protein RCG15_02635 [Candidatus Rickettsia vulgarisii]
MDSQTLKFSVGKSLSSIARQSKKIVTLASYNTIKLYNDNRSVIPDDLKIFNDEQRDILSSDEALNFFKNGYGSINDLKDLTKEQIKNIISDDAMKLYKEVNIELTDIKGLNKEQIENLSKKHKQ